MEDVKSSRDVTFDDEEKVGCCARCCNQRCILAGMGFWCFFVLSALRMNLSVAIVAMVNWSSVQKEMGINPSSNNSCKFSAAEERDKKEDGPFSWPPHLQGHILGCYFYGLAATQLLGGRLSEMCSAKCVLFMGTLIATISNVCIPIAADNDAYIVMGLQILKGCGQGIMMPSFSVLMGKWIPPSQRARFMSIIVCGMPIGGFLTVILSGFISKILGWPYIFYIFGTLAGVWCFLWLILIHDSPLTHPRITRRELNRIMSLKSQVAPQLSVPVPLKKILTSKPVWAYFAAGFASFWCVSLYVSVVPLFMGTVLKFDIEKNGTLSAIPNLVEAFFLICTSLISDSLLRRNVLRVTTIRKLAICTGLCGYAICMVIVTFTGCNRLLTVCFLVMALGMSGFNFASTAVVPIDMSPRFAGTISGIMNTFGALSGVIIPTVIGYLTEHRQTMEEWSVLFFVTAVICIFAVIIIISFGSSEVQPWNTPLGQREESEEIVLQELSSAISSSGPSSQPILVRESKGSQGRPWRDETFPALPKTPVPTVFIDFKKWFSSRKK